MKIYDISWKSEQKLILGIVILDRNANTLCASFTFRQVIIMSFAATQLTSISVLSKEFRSNKLQL